METQLVEWFDYTVKDLENEEKRKQVFKRMLDRLESEDLCRKVFHNLAFVLFKDDLK